MDTALGWLGDLVRTIATVFPRLCHVPANSRGVLFKRKNVYLLLPGLHFYWPVWSEVTLINVTRDTTQLHYQSLVTKDECGVTISVTIVHSIQDAVVAVAEVADLKGTISDVCAAAVKRIITDRDWNELKEDQPRIDRMLTRRCKRMLEPYGVAVESAYISELSQPITIRLMDNGG